MSYSEFFGRELSPSEFIHRLKSSTKVHTEGIQVGRESELESTKDAIAITMENPNGDDDDPIDYGDDPTDLG